jgi:ribonuclease PH
VAHLIAAGKLTASPITKGVAAISVGMLGPLPLLDLEYTEDSACDTDMNVVMTADGNFVEVQGTAEGKAFSRSELDSLLGLAAGGLEQIFAKQREVIATPPTPRPLGR